MSCKTFPSAHILLFAIIAFIVLLGLAAESEAAAVPGGRHNGTGRGGGGRAKTRGGRRGSGGPPRVRTPSSAVTVNPNPMPCKPRNTSVPLPPAPPGKLYLPNCAVVERCSGCCTVESIECLPKTGVRMPTITWKTNEYILAPGGKWRFNEVVSFEIEKHTKCGCGCKVRSEHCTALQSYDASGCRCDCSNHDESLLCVSPRYWDAISCSCKCPSSSLDCTTGSFMDPVSCRCIEADEIFQMVSEAVGSRQPDIYTL